MTEIYDEPVMTVTIPPEIDVPALMYFHAALNQMFFDGEIPPTAISTCPEIDYNDEFDAKTYIEWKPMGILFSTNITDSDVLDIVTQLLHEMVHQYCYIHGITDESEEESHNDAFREVALSHGLSGIGYTLQKDAEERIDDMIRNYYDCRRAMEQMVFAETVAAEEEGRTI